MAKGLTAEEIVGRFTGGVTGAGAKWEERTLAGAGRYTDWINHWYPGMLTLIPRIVRLGWLERVERVCNYTKGKAETYKAEKLRKLRALIAGAPGATPT